MIALILIAVLALSAHSWDTDGHKIVAKLAGELMSRKAARFLYSHLKGKDIGEGNNRMTRLEHSLVSVSAWADYISKVDASYSWSTELHFSHTPDPNCDRFVFDRDCGKDRSGRCVVSSIAFHCFSRR
jgi:hypothetical protein